MIIYTSAKWQVFQEQRTPTAEQRIFIKRGEQFHDEAVPLTKIQAAEFMGEYLAAPAIVRSSMWKASTMDPIVRKYYKQACAVRDALRAMS